MERITVNLEPVVARQLKAKATGENRSASGYVEWLIQQDLRAAGLLPGTGSDSAEFVAKVTTVVESNPDVRAKIEKVLRNATRAARAK